VIYRADSSATKHHYMTIWCLNHPFNENMSEFLIISPGRCENILKNIENHHLETLFFPTKGIMPLRKNSVVVSTHLKNISQIRNLPHIRSENKKICEATK